MSSVTGVPGATPKYTKKDFESDQDVRWCPGCGDYAILAAVQSFLPELGFDIRWDEKPHFSPSVAAASSVSHFSVPSVRSSRTAVSP